MSNFCTGIGLVLMWGTFLSTLGAGKDECPNPKTIEFAEYFAEWYVLGASVRYECEPGYQRLAGRSNLITCKNQSAQVQWTCRHAPTCTATSELTHHSSQQPSTKACERGSNSSQTTTHQIMKGVCGVPKALKHATIKMVKSPVGQKLQYRCMNGYHAWTPISEISTCEDSNGRGAWSSLTLRCTNDSSSVTEHAKKPPQSSVVSHLASPATEKSEEISKGSQTTSEQVMKAAVFTIAATVAVILL